MTGSISEFRIYEGRLTANEVAASFAAGPARLRTELDAAVGGDGRTVLISWPVAASDATLQFRTNLTAQPGWQDLGIEPLVTNDRCQLTLPPTNDLHLFRLRQ